MKLLSVTLLLLSLFFSQHSHGFYQGLGQGYAKASKQQQAKNLVVRNSQQAAQMVKSRFGGKVLKVVRVNGGNGYKVKLVKNNGHVVSVLVDAKTGKIRGN